MNAHFLECPADHAGDAQTQAAQAFAALEPGGRLVLHGYHRKHPGSLCHQASAGIWAFIKHHEDRLRVVSWDEPVTVEKHPAPRGWSLGECFSRMFGGVVIINLREATERRAAMEKVMEQAGVEPVWLTVDRISWDTVSPADYNRVEAYGQADGLPQGNRPGTAAL